MSQFYVSGLNYIFLSESIIVCILFFTTVSLNGLIVETDKRLHSQLQHTVCYSSHYSASRCTDHNVCLLTWFQAAVQWVYDPEGFIGLKPFVLYTGFGCVDCNSEGVSDLWCPLSVGWLLGLHVYRFPTCFSLVDKVKNSELEVCSSR